LQEELAQSIQVIKNAFFKDSIFRKRGIFSWSLLVVRLLLMGISKNLDRSYRTGSGICFGVVRMGFRHNGRTASFRITEAQLKAGNEYKIRSMMTIKDHEQPMEFTASVTPTPTGKNTSATLSVDRTLFGIEYCAQGSERAPTPSPHSHSK